MSDLRSCLRCATLVTTGEVCARHERRRRGRPPLMDAAAKAVVQIRLTAEQRKALEKCARANSQSLTEFARDAINTAAAECGERRVF